MLSVTRVKVILLTLLGLLTLISCSPAAQDSAPASVAESVTTPAIANVLAFKLGQDYELVREQASSTPQIVEHFSLYCVHCYHSEALFSQLKSTLARDVEFKRSHVLFLPQSRPEWGRNMTFSFAAARQLGIEDKFVAEVFNSHFSDKVYLGNVADIKAVFATLGQTGQAFDKALRSEESLAMVKTMDQQAKEDKVRFTPDLIINNKYRVKLTALKGHGDEAKRLATLVKFLLTNP